MLLSLNAQLCCPTSMCDSVWLMLICSCVQNTTEPVYFYIDVIFALHGLLLCSLFLTSWALSDSWLAGLLTAAFYIFNRYHRHLPVYMRS